MLAARTDSVTDFSTSVIRSVSEGPISVRTRLLRSSLTENTGNDCFFRWVCPTLDHWLALSGPRKYLANQSAGEILATHNRLVNKRCPCDKSVCAPSGFSTSTEKPQPVNRVWLPNYFPKIPNCLEKFRNSRMMKIKRAGDGD